MSTVPSQPEMVLQLADGSDGQELEEASGRLRHELLELEVDVAAVTRGWDVAPPGTKSVDATALERLTATLASAPSALVGVVRAVPPFVTRGQARTARLKLGDDEIELSGLSSEAQDELIAAFISRNVQPSADAG